MQTSDSRHTDTRVTSPLVAQIERWGGIARLETLWRAVEATATPGPFTQWPWVAAWIGETGLEPDALVVRDGDRPVGIALAQSRAGSWRRRPQVHVGQSGDARFDRVTIEYADVLAERGREAAVTGAALACLARLPGADRLGRRPRVVLPGVREATLAAASAAGLPVGIDKSSACPFVTLDDAAGLRHLDRLGRNVRQQVRRSLRLHGGSGEVALDRAGTLDQALDWLDELAALHQAQWRARGKPGAFAHPFFRAVHRRFLAEAFAAGGADLLRVRGEHGPFAYLYQINAGGDCYAYQSGVRLDPDNRLKPGLVAHALAIGHYAERGFARYHFMAGATRAKLSLSNSGETIHWLSFVASARPAPPPRRAV